MTPPPVAAAPSPKVRRPTVADIPGGRGVLVQVIRVGVHGVIVIALEQQPLRLLRRFSRTHQVPFALELLAEQLESQMSLRQLRLGIERRRPHAVVELRDMAAAAGLSRAHSVGMRVFVTRPQSMPNSAAGRPSRATRPPWRIAASMSRSALG